MYLCHAYGEDDSIITELNCHFRNAGIALYDSTGVHTKEKIAVEKYVIILLTDRLTADVMALCELNYIMELFKRKRIRVLTVVDKRQCSKIPKRLKWLLDTEFTELNDQQDLHEVLITAFECFLQDKEQSEGHYNIENIIGEIFPDSDLFIIEMLRIYHTIDDRDVRMKIMVVYSICTYLEKIYRGAVDNSLYYHLISYLFQHAGQDIPSSARQISIVERCLALLFRRLPKAQSERFC